MLLKYFIIIIYLFLGQLIISLIQIFIKFMKNVINYIKLTRFLLFKFLFNFKFCKHLIYLKGITNNKLIRLDLFILNLVKFLFLFQVFTVIGFRFGVKICWANQILVTHFGLVLIKLVIVFARIHISFRKFHQFFIVFSDLENQILNNFYLLVLILSCSHGC